MHIQQQSPWLSPFVVAIDKLRDDKRHDMLANDLYAHLLAEARAGDLLAIVGGPNCRTWSIAKPRWVPWPPASRPP